MSVDRRPSRWPRTRADHQAAAPVESHALLEACASVLGWQGHAVDRICLFGDEVSVVAEVDDAAHEQRAASGWGPVLDRVTLASWEDIPELWPTVPPRAVRLSGVMCQGSSWRRSLPLAGSYRGLAATAFLLDVEPSDDCRLSAHSYGVGVLHHTPDGGIRLVQPGLAGPVSTSRATATTRFAEELVYQRLVDDGLISAAIAD